ncbi:toprim domain-containing protein, partial [Candidatus Peregrinibacteria bacterium]|nr:toprim domain-containing protein [Candidatus Peregrinibacteria bacterium]
GKSGGDVINLVELIQQCAPAEAIKFLANRAGIELRPPSMEEQAHFDEEKKKSEEDAAILETLALIFQKNDEKAISYLGGRGISNDIVKEYRIGWSDYSAQYLKEALNDYSENAVNAVLANPYFFEESLIVPIIQRGRITSLYSRSENRTPKHMFLPGHPKGIFNHDKALLKADDRIYVAEAVIDVLSGVQHGIENVISIGGTQLGGDTKVLLQRLNEIQFVTCFDNDTKEDDKENAGYKATKTFMQAFPKTLMKALPTGDLNDFFKTHTCENFEALPELDWYTLLLNEIPASTKSEEVLSKLNHLFKALATGKDESEAILYILHTVKDYFDINGKDIDEVIKKYKRTQKDQLAELLSDGDQGEKESQSSLLLGLIDTMGEDAILFHTPLNEPFIRIKINGHYEIWACKSSVFKNWLAKLFWDTFAQAINPTALNAAINTLLGMARFDGDQHSLFNRVAAYQDAIWYDLCDPEWRVVKITKDGWSIEDNPPILFRRLSHQLQQVEPISDGDPNSFFEFVNISDKDTQLLVTVSLISSFIPEIPHVLFAVRGNQGAAKSAFCEMIRTIIDPSGIKLLSFPKNQQELAQQLSHHYVAIFDNVSRLDDDDSDALCRAITGGGYSKRELYTDDDDIIYSFRRVIGINGINAIIRKSDLLERSISIILERIPKNQRKAEKKLLADFQKALPSILGAIFDILVKALVIYPDIHEDNLPRMADYTEWGCAITEAMGIERKEFLKIYARNVQSQTESFLYDDLVASLIISLMKGRSEPWMGTSTELRQTLKEIGLKENQDFEKIKYFPQNANTLSRWLNRIKTALLEVDINAKKIDQRIWEISWVSGENMEKITTKISESAEEPTQESFLQQRIVNIMDVPF